MTAAAKKAAPKPPDRPTPLPNPVVPDNAEKPDRRKGVWVSFRRSNGHLDEVTPHASEIAALRNAVSAIGASKSVVFVPFDTEVEDADV